MLNACLAAQVLDLGLRLMHLLGSACRNGALGAWVASLVADADAGAARSGSAANGKAHREVGDSGCRVGQNWSLSVGCHPGCCANARAAHYGSVASGEGSPGCVWCFASGHLPQRLGRLALLIWSMGSAGTVACHKHAACSAKSTSLGFAPVQK